MNIIEKYYMKKASMNIGDELHTYIEPNDIMLLKRAQIYVFVAPTVTLGFVYLLSKLRSDILMSQHFSYVIKNFQEKMKS